MSINVMYAERAIDYVKNTVRMRADNRPEGVNRSAPQPGQVQAIRDEARKLYQQQGLEGGIWEAQVRAQVASQRGYGNCTEQSAIAFDYLRERGHRELAWIGCPSHNHMFVMLGMQTPIPPLCRGRGGLFLQVGEPPPIAWGYDTVVCDPWYHEWFRVFPDWNRKIPYILGAAIGRRPALPHGEQFRLTCRAYVP
jgi:hypothetical protein